MATMTVKSTYSLDVETVRQLEGLAKRWNTSKSAALRRAIHTVARQATPADNKVLDALNRLQSRLALDDGAAAGWENEVRRERRSEAKRSSR